jgi:hypothetical protein
MTDMAFAQIFRGLGGDQMIAAAGTTGVTQITPEFER